jgi:UDP-N-acetylmuramoylalanine--D-glutamate ligase
MLLELLREKLINTNILLYTPDIFEEILYYDKITGTILYMICKENIIIYDKNNEFKFIKEKKSEIIGGYKLSYLIDDYRVYIKGKKVAVLGIGVSNTPLIKFLKSMNVDVTAFDKAEYENLKSVIDELKDLELNYSLGENYLNKLVGFDVIFRTPGMRFDLPELVSEKARGAEITSEMEVFFDLCPAEIIAVTGSDGKTTTTTLIYKILKEQGYNCWLGGNIGTPLLSSVGEIRSTDKVILELSSFQLHTMKKSPKVAVITNLSPNHLDVHKSMEEYIEAKKNIFIFQGNEDKLILNFDNELTRGFSNESKGHVTYFSRTNSINEGAQLKEGVLAYKKGDNLVEIVAADEIVIPGVHNVENYLAAIAATIELVKPETIKKVAKTFKGVEHRNELVRELNGIKFYNSSIDSSPSRTTAALSVFKKNVILIAGGKDKSISYDSFGEIIAEKVKCLLLIGPTGPKIEKALMDVIEGTGKGKDIKIIKCETYEEIVKKAYDIAEKGDIVLLSPASTSFDMFKNFEERGNRFKEIVNSL